MIHLTPLLAELGSVEKFVIMALAVAGGFLIGFLLTNVIVRLLFKFVWKKTPPEKLIRVIRFAGGVGAAILVYLLLMGDGGLGLGGKGGGSADDKGKENAKSSPNTDPPQKDPKKEDTKQKVDDPRSGILTVYLLRNDSPMQKMYRLGKEGSPMTIDELLAQVDQLAADKTKPIVQVDIEIGDPNYAVLALSELQSKLEDRGIKSTRPIVKKPPGKN